MGRARVYFNKEDKKKAHNEAMKAFQKKKMKSFRTMRLTELVRDVFELEKKGLNDYEIAVELEEKGYLGTRKER